MANEKTKYNYVPSEANIHIQRYKQAHHKGTKEALLCQTVTIEKLQQLQLLHNGHKKNKKLLKIKTDIFK